MHTLPDDEGDGMQSMECHPLGIRLHEHQTTEREKDRVYRVLSRVYHPGEYGHPCVCVPSTLSLEALCRVTCRNVSLA
jgi:hypothetical protein